jgi:glutamate/tyrosine decarboxylase-like PLP-dependent enzyme
METLPWRDDLEDIIPIVVAEIRRYLAEVDTLPAKHPNAYTDAQAISTYLPLQGKGAVPALQELIEISKTTAIATSGPRCFHFVIGGSTPASMGADWLTGLYDQIAYAWVSSPLAVQLEIISLNWLAQLFGIPSHWGSIITTGATMSNFVGMAAARQWIGEQMGIDVAEAGLSGMPPITVLTSGHVHASTLKAMSMAGIGRANAIKCVKDGTGAADLNAIEQQLKQANAQPVILVATAGEPNAGAIDSISAMADLAEQYNCWLHVDGAFGLFARLSEASAHLFDGLERAHSITVDGHKWLNVPYDCGFAFVQDKSLLTKTFRYSAEYLPPPDDPEPVIGAMGPESSRRARSLSVWATLQAYGRDGYRQLINHHLDLAQHLARTVDAEPDLERLTDVSLNIVCFRYHPAGLTEDALNKLNKSLGERILADGRVYVGTTTYDGKTALRPAISSWRTEMQDVDLLVTVVLELGRRIMEDGG